MLEYWYIEHGLFMRYLGFIVEESKFTLLDLTQFLMAGDLRYLSFDIS